MFCCPNKILVLPSKLLVDSIKSFVAVIEILKLLVDSTNSFIGRTKILLGQGKKCVGFILPIRLLIEQIFFLRAYKYIG